MRHNTHTMMNGQTIFQLPAEGTIRPGIGDLVGGDLYIWTDLGFQFGPPLGELFVAIEKAPAGWRVVSTDHYKAAHYDRKATIYLLCRYRTSMEPSIPRDWDSDLVGTVTDGGRVIHRTEPVTSDPGDPYGHPAWKSSTEKALWSASKWRVEHYPDESLTAYWEDAPPRSGAGCSPVARG